ncbi:Pyrroline-5-carboxylate reductase [Acaryochloris thomasi RCC1774]|uniref:Pyrroline-5-carboxylate reductase n=1 Tax=Acaryochloris thomasi RCC1774 TaxID=1764569 RepID=A0A2W1JS52_9CYAN|nr:pyrroline-5-carboxylate reductase [Acaryochloris thomasi]PZD72804.1 Pyrroline-5-carboxylate reductase [Acaryochloris thomasi RCC1774]
MSITLGVIGGGVMAEAVLSRLIAQKVYTAQSIVVCDVSPVRLSYWRETYKVSTSPDNQSISDADVVLLATKPQVFPALTEQLQLGSSALVISILAGITLGQLESAFKGHPVIRAMPNTPATVGAGITALAVGQATNDDHLELAEHLFRAVGDVVMVPDSMMDAVTGLSGSGPAYVAIAIEALTDGGVAAGLPRAIAAKLALQTVQGTAALLAESGLHTAQLKDQVTSPGGTTIAGVRALEQSGFRSALIEAVQAAYLRSQALATRS